MVDPETDELPVSRPGLTQVALVAFVSSVVLFITMGSMAQALHLSWGLWFSEVFVFLAVPFITLQIAGRVPTRLTGLDQPGAVGLGAGFVIGVANYAALAVPLMWVSEQVFPVEVVQRYSAARLFDRQTGLELALLVTGVSVAAPFCEEFLYRGVLQTGLARKLDAPRAIVITALIFSLMHFDPVGFLARFELGVVFGLLAWRAGSLWPAIGAHAANNLVSVVMFLALGKDVELSGWHVAAIALGGLVALAAAGLWLARAQRWVAPSPGSDDEAPLMGLFRSLAPWAVAGVLAVSALAIADHRGVELNVVDLVNPMRPPSADASDGEHAAWRDLLELRDAVRRGEAPLDDYKQLRELASQPPAE